MSHHKPPEYGTRPNYKPGPPQDKVVSPLVEEDEFGSPQGTTKPKKGAFATFHKKALKPFLKLYSGQNGDEPKVYWGYKLAALLTMLVGAIVFSLPFLGVHFAALAWAVPVAPVLLLTGSLLILLPPLLLFTYTVMHGDDEGLPEKWQGLSFKEKLAAAIMITIGVIAALLPWIAGYVGGPLGVFFDNKLMSTVFIAGGSGLAGLTTLLHMNALHLHSFFSKLKEGMSGAKGEQEVSLPSDPEGLSESGSASLTRILWNQLRNMPFSAKLTLAFFVLLPVLPWVAGFVGGLASHGFIATLAQFAAKPAFAGLSMSVQAVWLFATVAAAVSAITVFFGFAVLTQPPAPKLLVLKNGAHGESRSWWQACGESLSRCGRAIKRAAPAEGLEDDTVRRHGSNGHTGRQSAFGGRGDRAGQESSGGPLNWLRSAVGGKKGPNTVTPQQRSDSSERPLGFSDGTYGQDYDY